MAIYQKDNKQVKLTAESDIKRYEALGYSEVNEKGGYINRPAKEGKKEVAKLEKENAELKAQIEDLIQKNAELSALMQK